MHICVLLVIRGAKGPCHGVYPFDRLALEILSRQFPLMMEPEPYNKHRHVKSRVGLAGVGVGVDVVVKNLHLPPTMEYLLLLL